jgi:hypothetical protein
MMITASGNKRGFVAVAFHQFKSEDATIKIQRALKIGDFEMDMADAHPRIDWFRSVRHFQGSSARRAVAPYRSNLSAL